MKITIGSDNVFRDIGFGENNRGQTTNIFSNLRIRAIRTGVELFPGRHEGEALNAPLSGSQGFDW